MLPILSTPGKTDKSMCYPTTFGSMGIWGTPKKTKQRGVEILQALI